MAIAPTSLIPITDGAVVLDSCGLKFNQCAVLLTGSKAYQTTSSLDPSFGYNVTVKGKVVTHQIARQFMCFDVRNYSGSISNVKLKVYSTSLNTLNKYIIVSSSAFGGDGSKVIATEDFGTIDRNTAYSNTETTWNTNQYNTISLLNTVTSSISESSYFTLALIDGDFDYPLGTPVVAGDFFKGIYQSGSAHTPKLEFTSSDPGWAGGDIMGISFSNISSVNGVDIGDIDSINGIT